MRALSSEFLKLFTTKVWIWLLIVVAALTAGLVTLIVINVPDDVSNVDQDIAEFTTVLSPIAYVVAATIGIIGITGEFRHQTITPTLLSIPQRALTVFAKIVVFMLFGALLGVIFALLLGGIAQPVLSGKGYDLSLSDDVVSQALMGAVLVSALFGVIGVGLGTLLRNQVATVVTTILFLFVIENILMAIKHVQSIYPYLPGGAAKAIMAPSIDVPDGVTLLDSSQATLVLAAWAVGLAVLGSITTLGRDVT